MLLDVVVGIHCLLETLVNLLERVEAVGVLLERIPEAVRQSIVGLQQRTAANTGMTMVIALRLQAQRCFHPQALRCPRRLSQARPPL